MPPSADEKLGPYKILSPLGYGGMGEVYKARDTRLDRTVAVKVLPEHIATRADLRKRFEREARVVASLNHPHICVLYDIGSQDATGYMVLEYLEGETLAARIARGALPIKQALQYAMQTADALDRAHRAGVTHRDVKPGNIMLTRDGVKVLDFGLAKSMPKPGPTEETIFAALTVEGTMMGTPQYMAPEQFEGKEADSRSDVWSFGAVLYEMLTGHKAFQGKTYASLVGAILSADPPAMAVTPFTPLALERLVRRCLSKDPEDRWQSMRDVVLDLQSIAATPAETPHTNPRREWLWPRVRLLLLEIAAVVLAMATVVMGWRSFQSSSPAMKAAMLSLNPPPGINYTEFGFALSPDGRNVAFVAGTEATQSIWVRPIDSLVARGIPGTEGGSYPFWSPDSKSLGFFSGGKLNRVELAGGAPRIICDAVNTRGGSWGAHGMIVFAPAAGGGLQRVSTTVGKPESVTTLDAGRKETEHRWPRFLPDGKRFLYWVQSVNADDTGVYVASVDHAAAPDRIVTSDRLAEYAPGPNGDPGFLLWVRGTTLLAQRFDTDRLRLEGDPVQISDAIAISGLGLAHFSASTTGTLIFGSSSLGMRRMQWRGRDGTLLGNVGPADVYYSPRLSPDEKRVAVARVSTAVNSDLWVYEFERAIMTRLTVAPGVDNYPAWSPDGRLVAFTTGRGGPRSLFLTDAAGSRREEQLTNAAFNQELLDWSSDNRYLLYREYHPANRSDIYLLNMKSSPSGYQALPFLTTPFDEIQGQFSPDAKWVVYVSNESGDFQLYVRAVPKGEPIPVSNQGASSPRWRRDSKEIFYISSSGRLMSVTTSEVEGRLRLSSPRELFIIPHRANQAGIDYDVSSDGNRFLVLAPVVDPAAAPLTVTLNWQSGLKK